MKIYLLRHAECVTNAENRLPLDDTPLTCKGKKQAIEIAGHLSKREIEAIYSSPLKRAMQTSEIIAGKLNSPIIVKAGLRDPSFGILSGMKKISIKILPFRKALGNLVFFPLQKYLIDPFMYFRIKQRILPVLREILNSGKSEVAIVGHLYINRIIISELLGLNSGESLNLTQPNDCTYSIDTEAKNVKYHWRGKSKNGILLKE